jgi:hypothetical protein
MPLENVPFAGWPNNARLFNADAEVIVSLDVGPRILCYRALPEGENLCKNYPGQMGGMRETKWMIRGGHRFWIAPEDAVKTYALDNEPVRFESPPGQDNTLILYNDATAPLWLEKTLTLTLPETGTGLIIDHRVINRGSEPVTLAPWGVTVMAADGLGLIPQPPLGEHPRDLAQNRRMIIWPYTNLTDSRWHFGTRLIMLRQDRRAGPTKIGLGHAVGWAGYLRGRTFFAKTVPFDPAATYTDDGCIFEIFSNEDMLELETLGGLVTLAAGEGTTHRERWMQHVFDRAPALDNEDALADQLTAAVQASGLLDPD